MKQNYIITDFDNATHWIPKQDSSIDGYSDVIIGKYYPIILDKEEDEYFIIDEKGIYSMIYLVHNGICVIIDEK